MRNIKTFYDHFDKAELDSEKWNFVNMGSPGCAMYEILDQGMIRLQESNMFYEGHALLSKRYLASESCMVEAEISSYEYGAGIGFYAGDGCWDNYIVFYILEDGHLEVRLPGGLPNGDVFMSRGQVKHYTVFKSDTIHSLPAVLKAVRNKNSYSFSINGTIAFQFEYDGLSGDAKALIKSLSFYNFSGPGEFKTADFHYADIDGFAPFRILAGQITDARGNGVSGASVHIAGEENYYVSADSRGYYTISNAPRGALRIVAAAEGFLFNTQNVDTGDEPVICNIVLEKENRINIPRSEYNRPDFDRSDIWHNLNGTWQFDFDKENIGELHGWYKDHSFSKAIKVPFSWSSLEAFGEGFLADGRTLHAANTYFVNYKITGENGWYRRSFTIPDTFPGGQAVILKIGACSAVTKVWLDGTLIGEGKEQYGQMDFDLGLLKPGSSHILVIKAQFPFKLDEVNLGKQVWWFNQSPGIWQTIWIEPRGSAYIKSIRTTPSLTFTGSVCTEAVVKFDIDAVLSSESRKDKPRVSNWQIDLTVNGPDSNENYTLAATIVGPDTDGNVTAEIHIPNPQLWRVNEGKLYTCLVKLQGNNKTYDLVKTYFGLRSVKTDWAEGHSPSEQEDIKEQYKYIYLNNQPVYMIGVLDQGYNPWGIYTYPSFGPSDKKGSIIFDIEKTKEFGYNTIRMHIKENEPLWYYYCDKAGVLVWNEHPSNQLANADNAEWRKVFEVQLRGMLDRLYNHPSIIITSVFNESWGIEGILCSSPWKNAQRQKWQKEMTLLAKSLDSARLVVDNSGYGKTDDTDITDYHTYPGSYAEAQKVWEKLINEDTYPGSTYNCYNAANGEGHTGCEKQSGQPLIISEFVHYDRIETLPRIFKKTAGYVRMNNTSQENEDTSPLTAERCQRDFGYVDRNFNPLGYSMINSEDMIIIDKNRVEKANAGSMFSADVITSHFSPDIYKDVKMKWALSGTDEYGNIHTNILTGSAEIPFSRFTAEKAAVISFVVPDNLKGAYLFVWVESEEKTVCQNYIQIDISGSKEARSDESKIVMECSPCRFSSKAWSKFDGSCNKAGSSVVWGKDTGYYEYTIPAVAEISKRKIKEGRIIFEAASRDAITGVKVTDEIKRSSKITVSLNGLDIAEVSAEDDPFDERALFTCANLGDELSYSYQGRYGYGYRFELVIQDSILNQILTDIESQKPLILRFSAKEGGITLYGNRSGRYGNNPMIILYK